MQFQHDDGGRAEAGFKGPTGDCVVRAIAIVTELPYRVVYERLFAGNKLASFRWGGKHAHFNNASPRNGTHRRVYEPFLVESLGFVWTPTMRIGSGCKVHLADGELPAGRLIVRLSGHLTAVIDGVIHDTYDPQRTTMITENGVTRFAQRCVYGYYQSPIAA